MKKFFYFAVFILCACSCNLFFTSCGDDEDDFGGTNAEVASITDLDGNAFRLYGVGNVRFEYDNSGQLTAIKTEDGTYEYKDGKFVASFEDEYYGESWEEVLAFSTNKDGLITKGSFSEITKSGGKVVEEDKMSFSYSYDSNNQCTSASVTYKFNGSGDGESYSGEGSGKATYTWIGGNLTKAQGSFSEKGSGKEGGKTYNTSQSSKTTVEFTYGEEKSPLRQMPQCIATEISPIDFGECDVLGVIGLCGKGPAYLPVKYTYSSEETEDGETERENYSGDINITLNANGTIATENGTRYSYQPVSDASTRAANVQAVIKELRGFRTIMGKHRRHGHK